jgi:hypothetical protein
MLPVSFVLRSIAPSAQRQLRKISRILNRCASLTFLLHPMMPNWLRPTISWQSCCLEHRRRSLRQALRVDIGTNPPLPQFGKRKIKSPSANRPRAMPLPTGLSWLRSRRPANWKSLTRFVGHSACRLAAVASRNRIAALALSAPRPRPAGRMSREESGIPSKRSAPQNSAASGHPVFASHLCRLIRLANFGKRAQPVVTDESVRAANCNS